MQVTKCDRCGAIYQPLVPKKITVYKNTRTDGSGSDFETRDCFLNCSRLVMTNRNRDYDLCEKCTEEILSTFKEENT